jgi:hypothetical protein
MQSVSISEATQSIQSKLDAIAAFKRVKRGEANVIKNSGNSSSPGLQEITSQLGEIKNLQKRFQRESANSFDRLLKFIETVKGTGPDTYGYLRRMVLSTAIKIEPKMQEIIQRNALKAIGCSQEQTYDGLDPTILQLTPINLLPPQIGTYIPIQSIDLFNRLKISPDSPTGKFYYEKDLPSADPKYKPYGGKTSFPMNRQLYDLINNGQSLTQLNGENYNGVSLQDLFDIQYTNVNEFGVNGDFMRIVLLNRTPGNDVGSFLSDYYRTIKVVDSVSIAWNLINILVGAIDFESKVGINDVENQKIFTKILLRILGLCYDSRREIDVSGVSKIGELDGVDDSFFELNEIDLREIEVEVNNIQNGVVEFIECDNVKLPLNSDVLVDELIRLRERISEQNDDETLNEINQIINSISENPNWVPNPGFKNLLDKDILNKIPLAIFSAVLTPKVLLPIFALLSAVQSKASVTYQEQVKDLNNNITDVNNNINDINNVILSGDQVANVVINAQDFLKKFRTFSIDTMGDISEVFLEVLFEELKKDIFNLVLTIIKDIERSKIAKKYTRILRLLTLVFVVAQTILNLRQCKSLLNNIQQILRLLLEGPATPGTSIPSPLLLLAKGLPGVSTDRATINVVELMQKVGLPTGDLPDGTPNQMVLFAKKVLEGYDLEVTQNGKVSVMTPAGPGYGIFE